MIFNTSVVSGIRAVVGSPALSLGMLIVSIFVIPGAFMTVPEYVNAEGETVAEET